MALYIFILQRLLLPVKLSPSFSNLSPHLNVLLTGYEFSFPPSPSAAFYQQSSLYRSLPSGNDLSGPWEKKGKAWKTEFHIQRRATTLINTFVSASNPSFWPFHSLLSSAFTSNISRFLPGWWMDERNLRSGLYGGPGGIISGMLGLLFAHLWNFNNSIWCNAEQRSINHNLSYHCISQLSSMSCSLILIFRELNKAATNQLAIVNNC